MNSRKRIRILTAPDGTPPITDEDTTRINILLRQLSPRAPTWNKETLYTRLAERYGPTYVIAIEIDGVISAMASCYLRSTLMSRVFATVEDVVVDEACRRMGLAEELMSLIHDFARSAGTRYMELTSQPSREGAHKLYAKIGYTEPDTTFFRMPLA